MGVLVLPRQFLYHSGLTEAARPPANTSDRSVTMVCSRWSRVCVKSQASFEVSQKEGW